MSAYKIAVINLGSTSTKIAYYEDDKELYKENIRHNADELAQFEKISDQLDYRYEKIDNFFKSKGVDLAKVDCIAARGGNISPHPGGVYRITKKFDEESTSGNWGVHPSTLGSGIALKIAENGAIPISVDPPTTDEFEPLARYSGLPEIQRTSSFQALNQRAAAKKCAEKLGKNYEDLNIIVVMLGGGISVVAHKKGQMVDGNNALDGDGPFSTNRTGDLPVGALIDMCYSGEYTHDEMKKKINGKGGLTAYLGENDAQVIEERAKTDEKYAEVLEAMCYQVSKEVGSIAAVLKGDVDAIVFTGGMANSKTIVGMIEDRVSFIAPSHVFAGEFEMETLAKNALAVLKGEVEPKEL